MRVHHLKIKPNGTIEFFGNPPKLLKLPLNPPRRFSVIEPTDGWLRLAFRCLRFFFGERGMVAAWTREWQCTWKATILLGPAKGDWVIHRDRNALVTWEHAIWADHRFTPRFEI